MLSIKANNGLWWNANNNCLGPKQAATEYPSIDDLPLEIDGAVLEIHAFDPMDMRYYIDDRDDAVASVVLR